jgi:hypothetical protein
VNLLFSYFDTSTQPPKQLLPEQVFNTHDTIAPILSKIYTSAQHSLPTQTKLGINPFPLSILPAQLTFLPLVSMQSEKRLVPVARFNVPMLREHGTSIDEVVEESVARTMGYVAGGETYSSLKPALLGALRDVVGDVEGEFRKFERRSATKWIGMEVDKDERVGSEGESPKKVKRRSGEGSSGVDVEGLGNAGVATEGGGASVGMQLRREVGAWWGRKIAE